VKRRDFIVLLSGAAAWPVAVRARQAEPMRRIGVLSNAVADSPDDQARLAVFGTSLEQFGRSHATCVAGWPSRHSATAGCSDRSGARSKSTGRSYRRR
jgi:hypothetical protein